MNESTITFTAMGSPGAMPREITVIDGVHWDTDYIRKDIYDEARAAHRRCIGVLCFMVAMYCGWFAYFAWR